MSSRQNPLHNFGEFTTSLQLHNTLMKDDRYDDRAFEMNTLFFCGSSFGERRKRMDRTDRKCRCRKMAAQGAIFVTAFVMIIYGVTRGEMATVLNKAVNICLECLGLG